MIFLLLLSLIALSSGGHEDGVIWNYEGPNGVEFWSDLSENCGGSNQSPVNVICNDVVKTEMECFNFTDYKKRVPTVDIINLNGRTVEVIPNEKIKLSGGGLNGNFELKQFHCHWGKDNDEGSEHTIDSKSYPLEVHFVHMNEKYSSLDVALENPDGIAVLGVFYEIGHSASAIRKIAEKIKYIRYANEETRMKFDSALIELLPKSDCEYFRYQGSLTTPNCNEAVIWTLFPCPVSITQHLLNKFRVVHQSFPGKEKQLLGYNFRPTQPLNGRIIKGNTDCHC
uniref:Carbonic anhydrase n=1 Tax=Tityus obscurus TaxID=1221240 RepID=A0A1E1WVQ2_TITOB